MLTFFLRLVGFLRTLPVSAQYLPIHLFGLLTSSKAERLRTILNEPNGTNTFRSGLLLAVVGWTVRRSFKPRLILVDANMYTTLLHFSNGGLFCYCRNIFVSPKALSVLHVAFVLWVATVRSDWIIRTVVQANVAHVDRLIEESREPQYQRKDRERFARSRDNHRGSEVAEMEIQSRERRVTRQREQK